MLESGEELATRSTASDIRMLGAVRAASQCLQCHQVRHGDMLGAFSYEIVREGAAEERPSLPPLSAESL